MKLLRLGLVGILTAVIVMSVPLSSVAAEDEAWEFTLTPYIWMAGIEGDVKINRQKADVDIYFSDILDNLDFGGMIHLEAKKGRFGFYLDPDYLKVSVDKDLGLLGNTDTEFELEIWIIDFGGFYRIGQWGTERTMSLDVLFGGRYWHTSTEVNVDNPILGVAVDQKSEKDLLDPTVGFRFRSSLSDRFQVSVRADIGGFDISDNTSKLSWQAIGLLGYEVSKNATLFVGYRAINLDNEKSGSEMDLTLHGPVIGLTITFGGSKA